MADTATIKNVRRISVDPSCHEMAAAFLREVKGSTPEDITELAQDIQRTVEDFIASLLCVED